MCVSRARTPKHGTYLNKDKDKVQKVIERVEEDEFEKANHNFVNEDIAPDSKKKKPSLIASLLE